MSRALVTPAVRARSHSPQGLAAFVQGLLRACRQDAAATIGVVFTAAILFTAVAGPVLSSRDPVAVAMGERLRPPSRTFPLGTDELGRDILTRIVHGARISVILALVVILSAAAIGSIVGGIAGFAGGFLDSAAMRVVDLLMAFPYLILAMVIAFALGPGSVSTMIALAVVWWPSYARLVRGLVLVLRQHLFVEAARALGASTSRTLRLHILPHCLPALIVRITTDLGFAIIAGASLSFIGLGPQPPSPDWGAMIANARFYVTAAWWLGLFPGLALFVAVMGFALLGDALHDVGDPRLRMRG
jgi:peptide/nickel transport system permease protein